MPAGIIKLLTFAGLFLSITAADGKASASQFALRARENIEFQQLKGSRPDTTYKGLSSTVNAYYEEPYALSYGLGFNFNLGNAFAADSTNSVLGDEFTTWGIGGDIKYFPSSDLKGFVRGTAGYQRLNFNGPPDTAEGVTFYVGGGWEFPMFELFSLAPELGFKKGILSNGIRTDTVLFALGVHFYSLAKKQ